MMNKQNPNPWARWKALLFIPLAALLTLAFARPEINRELEQISAFKGTEILQENIVWNEEKFLEELRKSLPAGVSRELSYEDTWIEILKKYQSDFKTSSKTWNGFEVLLHSKTGMLIMMNAIGEMLVNNEFAKMEDIPALVAKNLANKGKPISPIIIDGKQVDKIIRYTLIQRDMNTPADNYQKLYQTVGEAYMQKRNEIARQYYQTGYNALDAEKKTVIENVVPILVMIEKRGPFVKTTTNSTPLPTEDEWKKAAEDNSQQKKELQSGDIIGRKSFNPNRESEPSNIMSVDDMFFPSGITNPREYKFSIFKRTGEKIFETTDPSRGWNGYFEGNRCEGTYFYLIAGEFETGQPFREAGSLKLDVYRIEK